MVLGRIIEQANVECHLQDDNSAYLLFQVMSPDPFCFFTSFPRLAGKYQWREFPAVSRCNTVLGNTSDLAIVENESFLTYISYPFEIF